jgi:DNA-binding transcriptional LysR family regulator
MSQLRQLDLNLLLTLDALLEEGNVTRAARRLHYSQPSVSVQLAKLRHALKDPLLLPGPRGMRPTARAQALRVPLREALRALESAVAPEARFEPAQATQTWTVAATDYGESAVLLPLLPRLRAQAPGTRLAVVELEPARMTERAERGEIDLALHISSEAPRGLRHAPLFGERYVLVGRADHPALKRRPTLARFCALEHVVVSPDGGGFAGITDRVLAQAGAARKVVLSVPHFLFMLEAVAATDLVAMMPARLAAAHVRAQGGARALRVTEAPVEIPGYEMAMFWPERVHRDPAHAWLREQVRAAV